MGAGAAVALTAGPAMAGQTDDLKSQIDSLQARLDQIEKQQATTGTAQVAAPADAVVGGDFPGSFKLPGSDTSFQITGFVKLAMSVDSNQQIGDANTVAGMAANNTSSGNIGTHFAGYANQSRLHIETRTPTDYGAMKTVMEFDYRTGAGSSAIDSDPTGKGVPRLRLAYGVLGPVEAGKDFELFENDFASAPETIDYWGPQGPSYGSRIPLIKYTQAMGKFTLAAEIASPSAGGSSSGSADQEGTEFLTGSTSSAAPGLGATPATDQVTYLPQFTAGADYADAWGHIAVRGKVREFSLTNGGGSNINGTPTGYSASATGYAGYFGASVNPGQFIPVLGKDSLGGAIVVGVGDVQDLSGADDSESFVVTGFGTATSKITPTPMKGFMVNYRHWWTDTIRSTVMWGMNKISVSHDAYYGGTQAQITTPSGIGAAEKQTQTVWANIIWSPVKTVNFGLEYAWGQVSRQNALAGYSQYGGGTQQYTGYGSNQRVELGMQYLF
jgi:hypothetical protein